MKAPTWLGLVAALSAAPASAATLTVLTTADSGAGSLRQAITDANFGLGADLIVFNLPGIGVKTITLASPLPSIVDSVTIDGYSQPGALENSLADGNDAVLLVELDGTNLAPGSSVLEVLDNGTTIRGLVINRAAAATSAAIALGGTGGHVVQGNFVGTNAAGNAASPNDTGIRVSSPNNLIGGDFPAARNLISANAFSGVALDGGDDNAVRGNFIGTDRGGTGALGNGRAGVSTTGLALGVVGGITPGDRNVISGNTFGIESFGQGFVIEGNFIGTDVTGTLAVPNSGHGIVLLASGHRIGGAGPGAGNLISGNAGHGILLQGATDSEIYGNRIGTDVTGTAPLPNAASGINSQFGFVIPADNTIGGFNPGEGNVIAFNGSAGIALTNTVRTSIRRNRIFRNREVNGLPGLGIDLDHDGVTPNDDGDGDSGANALLNFPLIRSATAGPGTTRVQGTLRAAAGELFGVDFFWSSCNFRPRDFLQGENVLGSELIVTDGNGFAEIDVTFAVTIPDGAPVSATLTDTDGNTSEFSQQIVFAIAPASGPQAGGTAVSISGTNFDPGVTVAIGGVPASNVVRVSDTQITAETPALPPGSLNDVVVTNPDTTAGTLLKGWVADFLDVPAAQQFYAFVTRLVSNGVTVGCGGGLYCVGNPTTREQMAVFLLRARLGFCFTPPPATGTVFADVPASSIYAPWIEELQRQGLTAGCGNGNYCPDDSVTRAQMAVFLLNTAYGPGYVPPPATGTVFDDVPLGAFADEWIEDLVGRGITAGCSAAPPLYCPLDPITRGQMATFIVKTFDLQP